MTIAEVLTSNEVMAAMIADRSSTSAIQGCAEPTPMRFGHKIKVPVYLADGPNDLREKAHKAIHRTKMALAGEIATKMGNQPHTIRYEVLAPPRIYDWDDCQTFVVSAWVTPVKITEIKVMDYDYEPGFKSIDPRLIKHNCNFCSGITYDDERGNCGACGAPRGR